MTRIHAFGDDALGDLDAVGLAAALRSGAVGSDEVVEAAIARCEKVEPALAGLAAQRFDSARSEAQHPASGFFSGVPAFIKDNCDIAGLPTQQGTKAYVGKPKSADGDVARMLGAQGLIVLGKTRLSEFGFSGAAEFIDDDPVRNPWNPDHTSGASSAGSAAFVAAGVVPIAHANDGGGSIRIPASCCGLVGMKPTRFRTPSDAMTRQMPLRIVADGVVTRTVRDTAAYLRESEKIYRNPSLPPVGDVQGPSSKRLRIAVITDSISGRVTDAETRDAVLAAAALLEGTGHHVDLVSAPVPDFFTADFLAYWSTFALFLTAMGKRELDPSFDASLTDNLTKGLAQHAKRSVVRLPLALPRLWGSQFLTRQFFTKYDVTLSPTLGHVTPALGHFHPGQSYETVMANLLEWVSFTPLHNATGDPAISVPGAMSSSGLPIGVHLSAGHGQEARLLELAYELEQVRPFPQIAAS